MPIKYRLYGFGPMPSENMNCWYNLSSEIIYKHSQTWMEWEIDEPGEFDITEKQARKLALDLGVRLPANHYWAIAEYT